MTRDASTHPVSESTEGDMRSIPEIQSASQMVSLRSPFIRASDRPNDARTSREVAFEPEITGGDGLDSWRHIRHGI